MASGVYTSFILDCLKGNIDTDVDTFKVMILTNTYVFNKDHTKRSDLTNEVTGTGYTAGGNVITLTPTQDTVNDRVDTATGSVTWPSSTISAARQAAIYKSRGGAATADELVANYDHGADVSTSAGTLTLSAGTIRVQT